MAVGGGSADRKAEELAAAGDRSAGAWAAGAEGERRVAAALSQLPEAWTVLHDRLLSPGLSPVNLDHVVVGPGGAFLIDAKNWKGSITAWEGGLYQHTGAREARHSESKHREVAKVHAMGARMAEEAGMPVTRVICLAGRHEAHFGEPQLIRGVWVTTASDVAAWLHGRPVKLERAAVERAAVTLMTSFPSTTTDPQLLAAMGAAAQAARAPRQSTRRRGTGAAAGRPAPARPVARARPPRRGRSALKRVLRVLLALALIPSALAVVSVLPGLIVGGIVDAPSAPGPSAGTPSGSAPQPAASAKPAAVQKSVVPQRPAPAPAAVPTGRCAGLTASQVGAIVGRKVHPVAWSQGCMWGSRLDDPTTSVVSLRTQTAHRPHESQFVTSASQRRVVYGTAYDNKFHQATALWVASGQPIVGKQTTVTARVNTHVIVSIEDLDTTDEKGRWMARAIAMGMNAAP